MNSAAVNTVAVANQGSAKPAVCSVVVPVYYNEGSLPPLFEKLTWLEEQLAQRGMGLELVFVDDGSKDRSFEELQKIRAARPNTKLVKLTRNFGAVAASNTGFQFVTGDCFMILAADLQDPVENILRMVELWQQGSRFVIAVREDREDPPATKLFASIYYFFVKRLVYKTYPEGGFDQMLMDKSLLPYLRESSVHTNPNMLAYWLGHTPTVINYRRQKRLYGKSRWTFWKKLNFFLDTLTGFSVAPIRLVSLIGVGSALVSLLYGTWMLLAALFGFVPVPGFATLVVLISFFSGLMLFILGMIGEYLWRIFDLVNRKPKSVIEIALVDDAKC